jgi:hypothetical protein
VQPEVNLVIGGVGRNSPSGKDPGTLAPARRGKGEMAGVGQRSFTNGFDSQHKTSDDVTSVRLQYSAVQARQDSGRIARLLAAGSSTQSLIAVI